MTSSSIGAAIAGTGSAVPARVMTNSDFEKILDTSDEWIRSRTGIRERRICSPGETTATLGLDASRRALDAAGMKPSDIDLIICATITPEMFFPSTACFIQAGLGCRNIGAFDLMAACSGFVYSLAVGSQFIKTGAYRNVLVVGADTMSRVVDFQDRSICVLFGDAAGAAVLTADAADPGRGLNYFRMYADGSQPELMSLAGGGSRHPASPQMLAEKLQYMRMNGREVYKFASLRMQELVRDALADNGLTADDVALVVPHQVNRRIIDAAVGHMNFPPEKVYVNLDRFGNTSAASVPLALDEAVRAGRVKRGDKIVLVAFGGGLTWSSAVVTW
jgi:3-oxoacyl-[acyl-carrier-protein] synthase-3